MERAGCERRAEVRADFKNLRLASRSGSEGWLEERMGSAF